MHRPAWMRRVHPLLDGHFTIDQGRLLAGAGSGVTVKAAMRPLLVETDDALLLVDTGMPKIPAAVADLHQRLGEPRLVADLARLGVSTADVTHVVVTHLHYDHADNVDLFHDADRIVQADHLAFARDPPEGWASGFAGPAWRRVEWTTVDGETEIVDGVRVLPTPGHVPGHQSVLVDTDDGLAICPGDAAPVARSLERDEIPGICYDEGEAKRSLERLKGLEGTFHFYHGVEGEETLAWG